MYYAIKASGVSSFKCRQKYCHIPLIYVTLISHVFASAIMSVTSATRAVKRAFSQVNKRDIANIVS